ncbi:Hypothetical predicted protein [Cloeon dipterum]|uniref:Uncharacterized protein n=1 Tax=Cloeon dipterum TaxID=197152 RepID=A0A8S1DUR8_9INSE|nr:Hypothetical predicted protein [Cloeon dipterum]
MRATIAIFLLISLSQCRAHPVARESSFEKLPAVPRVTEKPTDGAVTTDAPVEAMQTPDEFLLNTLLHWDHEVLYQGIMGWAKMNHNMDAPLNAFRWTFREYNKLNERILSLCDLLKGLIEQEKKENVDFIPFGPPGARVKY